MRSPQTPSPDSVEAARQAKAPMPHRLRAIGRLAAAAGLFSLTVAGLTLWSARVQADIAPPDGHARPDRPVLDAAREGHQKVRDARQEALQGVKDAIEQKRQPEEAPQTSSAAAPPSGSAPEAGTPSSPDGSAVAALPASEGPAWPTEAWSRRSLTEAGIDPAEFQKGVDYAFSSTGNEEDRAGIRTDGLVVIHKGYLVFEQYARGYNADKRHMAWSVTKSITSALIGIAVGDRLLAVDEPAARYYPPLNHDQHEQITIAQLLRMSSGLAWEEGYEASPLRSSVLAMLYTAGRVDMAAFAASQPVVHAPDTYWQYSSGTTNILCAMLKNILGEKAYTNWPWERLFNPIGMRSAVLERDQSGTFVGSSYLHATLQDLARFGYLYLRKGRWSDQQLIPEQYVDWSREMAPALSTTPAGKLQSDDRYGAMWWLNAGISESAPKAWKDVPDDAYAAEGHWGQYIIVLPSQDLVIVRTGDDRDGSFDPNTMLKSMLASLPKETP